jgi:hypothetical protein
MEPDRRLLAPPADVLGQSVDLGYVPRGQFVETLALVGQVDAAVVPAQ